MENFGLLTSLQLICGAFKGYVWQMYWDYYCVFSFGEYIKSIYKILVLNIFLVMYIFPTKLELRHGIIPFKSSFHSQAQPEVSLQVYSCLQVQHTSLFLLACLLAFVNLTSVLHSYLALHLGVDALDFLLLSGPASLRENISVTFTLCLAVEGHLRPLPSIGKVP